MADGLSNDDHRFMARALQLAERGLFTTDPNPRVGCVLVKGGEIVGEGWHQRAGEPHAEINALQAADTFSKNGAKGATAYVTLEPCCHHGRTPPCSEALIAAGVSRVVVAMEDPNPQVVGQGMAQLQKAGIEIRSGVLQVQAEALNPGFIQRMRHGRPYVRGKMAMSLDGRTAMASGESQWITGAEARQDVHRLRARSAAMLTGISTVLADDPSLTARLPGAGGKVPAGSGSLTSSSPKPSTNRTMVTNAPATSVFWFQISNVGRSSGFVLPDIGKVELSSAANSASGGASRSSRAA